MLPNRATRRLNGWTEPRVRKMMHANGMWPPVLGNPKSRSFGIPAFSTLQMLDQGAWAEREKQQRVPRVTGQPRRWQVERERRKIQAKMAHG